IIIGTDSIYSGNVLGKREIIIGTDSIYSGNVLGKRERRRKREKRDAKNGDRRQEPVSPYFRSRLLVSEASPRYSFSALTNNAQPTTALTTPC
ncbi:MAG TPA: hypothetical protein PKY42_04440, partial [Mesotoga sp.]|nr:hypothetical protein [Mesotoga sp.]